MASELSKKRSQACCQYDVVDVEQHESSSIALVVDKQRSIGASGAEAKLMKNLCDPLVPGARSLLKPIQGPREQAHMTRRGLTNESRGLLTEQLFLKMTMKEGVGNVHLMHMQEWDTGS